MATPIRITDANDPRIEAYRDVRERDLVGRQGLFVAEGEVVLRLLLRKNPEKLESILLSEKRGAALVELIPDIPENIALYIADDAIIERIAGFPVHRGVLAIGRKALQLRAAAMIENLETPALVLLCVGIANHDNIGGIFRNAAAFGASALLLDETSCDPLYRKAIRVSVGASLTVPFTRGNSAKHLIEILKAADFSIFALSPSGNIELKDAKRSLKTALILGAEGPGLPQEILSSVQSITIKMAGDFDSLNVATTSGIALHHFSG